MAFCDTLGWKLDCRAMCVYVWVSVSTYFRQSFSCSLALCCCWLHYRNIVTSIFKSICNYMGKLLFGHWVMERTKSENQQTERIVSIFNGWWMLCTCAYRSIAMFILTWRMINGMEICARFASRYNLPRIDYCKNRSQKQLQRLWYTRLSS